MPRRVKLFWIALGIAGLAAMPGPGAGAAPSSLTVEFNQDGSITVALADGTPVGTPSVPGTLIPAGTYEVTIDNPYRDDGAVVHLFDLSGPGVKLVSDMNEGEETAATWIETFQPGSTYTYQDDNRPAAIHGVFRTTAVATASVGSTGGSGGAGTVSNTPTSSSGRTSAAGTTIEPGRFRGTLRATVAADGKLTLSFGGSRVSSLRSGRYAIAVTDRARTGGFTLQEKGRQSRPLTGASFVGRRSVRLALEPGQWFFSAGPGTRKSYFIVVA